MIWGGRGSFTLKPDFMRVRADLYVPLGLGLLHSEKFFVTDSSPTRHHVGPVYRATQFHSIVGRILQGLDKEEA